MSLEVKFNRLDKTYNPGERVSGVVIATCDEVTKHNGLTLNVTGFVTLILSARNMGLFEAFSNNMKPLQLVNYTIPIAPAGKLVCFIITTITIVHYYTSLVSYIINTFKPLFLYCSPFDPSLTHSTHSFIFIPFLQLPFQTIIIFP